MKFLENNVVLEQINQQPPVIQERLLGLRDLIIKTAESLDDDDTLEETLKWSEPSYCCEKGSTIRINRIKNTDKVGVFFNCKSSLIETFRELYHHRLSFEANRAIVFNVDSVIPVDELKHCIALALTYHRVKHLPLLGA